jgi:hypothetical protein
MSDLAHPRDLFGPGQSVAIRDLLQALLAAELLSPSRELWLLFGWISDIEVLDNRSRQFSALRADWPASPIRLLAVLEALLDRGATLCLVLRNVSHNQPFIQRLQAFREGHAGRLRLATGPEVHEKGVLGDDFLLSGSMNLTYNGMVVNDEHVTLRTDAASIEEWRMSVRAKWGPLLK